MKFVFVLASSLILLASSFKIATEILEKLGVEEQNANWSIMRNLINVGPRKPNCSGDCDPGPLVFPRATALKSVITGDKKAAAKELCGYIKAYVESEAFNSVYQKERAANDPLETPRTLDPKYSASLKEQLTEMEKTSKSASTQQEKDMYAPIIASMKDSYKESLDPTPRTTAWREKFPATPDSLVTKQLKFYLAELATVDFNAQLIQKGKYKVFANPEFEKKGQTWKKIFRSGKEVNDVVKIFVTDWMKQGVKYTAVSESPAKTAMAQNTNTPTSSKATVTNASATEAPTTPSTETVPTEKKKGLGLKGLKNKATKVINQ